LDVFPTAQSIGDVTDKVVLIVDVLRATSVITTALINGAEMIIPVTTIEEALNLKENYKQKAVLGGERNAVKPQGFDVGNSPLEYSKESIYGKKVILTTSNGTNAIRSAKNAKHIIISCFLNAEAAAKQAVSLSENKTDIAIVCAGTLGNFSLDDIVCAGALVDYICNCQSNFKLSDLALASRTLYKTCKDDLSSLISHGMHYNFLIKQGFEQDVRYCLQQNVFNIVPFYDFQISAIRI